MYALNTNAAGAYFIGDISAVGAFSGGGGVQSAVYYVLGAPYFLAASGNGTITNLIFTRLDTGQVYFVSSGEFILAGDGTLTVGSRGNGNPRQINGGIAAAMASNC